MMAEGRVQEIKNLQSKLELREKAERVMRTFLNGALHLIFLFLVCGLAHGILTNEPN